MTSKIHHLVDGRGAPMVVVVSAGQSGDSPMLPVLLDHLSVPRIGPGRARTPPDRVRGDKAPMTTAQPPFCRRISSAIA